MSIAVVTRTGNDVNGDVRLDIADVDALVGLIVGGQYGEFEDLNRDGVIDNAKTS